MELKDVILSTLAEMEEDVPAAPAFKQESPTVESKRVEAVVKKNDVQEVVESSDSELAYLNSIRERLLVLFEGFQAPNNINIEAKVDMTLNFLEYVLATIDARVDKLERGSK
ncbi:MAG: hypothetical protein U9Q40_11035 [Campylobacterota bacterium]|nr:hypothetical protein [Campylobacterota bacterium]